MPAIRERIELHDEIEKRGDALVLGSARTRVEAQAVAPSFAVSAPEDLSKAVRLQRTGDANTWLEVHALGLESTTKGAVEKGAVIYRTASRDLDVIVSLGDSRLEELRVLSSDKAASTARYALSVAPGMQVRTAAGRIEVLGADGRVAFETNAAFAVDSAGTKRSVALRLVGSELSASFDASGLKYPVVVDPEWVTGPTWPAQAVVAQNSLDLASGGAVVGDATVIQRSSGTFLGTLAPAQLDSGAQLTGSLSADRIQVQSGSVVTGDVHFNTLSGSGVIRGERFPTLSVPVAVSAPTFPVFAPGTQDVTTTTTLPLQLAPGNYRAANVKSGSILQLAGGVYAFSAVSLAAGSRVECLAACDVRVLGRFVENTGNFFGPSATSSIGPDSVEVFVAAANGTSSLTAQPAVTFASGNTIRGRFFAPNGTITLASGVQVVGTLVGKDVLPARRSSWTIKTPVLPA